MSTGPGLPEHLQAKLASALEEGAKPVALSPLQARYTAAPAGVFARLHIRGGTLAFATGAVAMLVVLALAGNPAPRTWIVQSVNSAVQRIIEPEPSPSPSATPENKGTAGEAPHPTIVPSGGNHETPESRQSPEPSHEPLESPRPGEPHESPRPVPSESPGPGDHGHDQSPSPTPSPTPSGEGHR